MVELPATVVVVAPVFTAGNCRLITAVVLSARVRKSLVTPGVGPVMYRVGSVAGAPPRISMTVPKAALPAACVGPIPLTPNLHSAPEGTDSRAKLLRFTWLAPRAILVAFSP